MDIEHVLLADYAEVVGGKLYLMGGGWDTNTVNELPAALRLAVALGLRIEWDETDLLIPVLIRIEDDDGREYLRMEGSIQTTRPADLPDGATQLSQLAANLPLTLPSAGGYNVRVLAGSGDNEVQRSLPFRVFKRA
ncbi:MAG: hypothetical protein ABI305_13620 [Tepidiformaceae bacterium]